MRKVLSLLIVFLGVAVGSFAQTTTTFPKVVATFSRLNQTAAIPTTTIYTPPKGGLFRVTIYGAITVAHGTGVWVPEVQLTNEAIPVVLNLNMNSRPVNFYLAVLTTWNKEGFPITVNVAAEGEVDDPAGDSEYNVRVVVEQLM